jgi:glycosyltransferase involved in cell wall biosynthesis
LKVLHVIVGLQYGGAERMLTKVIEASSEQKHVVVSLTTLGDLGSQLLEGGCVVHAIGMRSAFGLPAAWLRLVRLVRREAPDVIQTWMYHSDLIGGLAARVNGVPCVWGVRTTELPRKGSQITSAIRWCCARLSKRLPTKIIYAAHASRAQHEQLGYDIAKSVVIPNGFEIERLSAAFLARRVQRAELGIGENDRVIGTVGRFHDDKDHFNFLVAASKLLMTHKSLRFIMVGRDLDSSNTILMNWIDDLQLGDAMLLLGERTDVPECLSVMDVFCLPSKTEGFPNVLGEAMGVGVPCVATDVGDVKVVLGDCGLVVPRENSQALAAGLRQVLYWTEGERAAHVNAGQRRVADDYSIDSTCRKFELVYSGIKAQGERTCAV